MKVMKTIDVPAKKQQIFDGFICELCKNGYGYPPSGLCYDVCETEIELREGQSYPEGGYGKTLNLDICSDCFKSKLIPWFESQGGKVRKEDYDH